MYRVKPAVVRGLDPVLAWLERARVDPDALTLAAIPVAAVGGLAVLVSPAIPAALLAVPVAAASRILLNLLDGALARRTARTHPRGAWLNELGDRIGDVLLLAPVAFIPGAIAAAVWVGIVLALLSSFSSVAARAAGGERTYRGILSKPGRMVLLVVFSIAVVILGQGAWAPFGPLLVVGGAATLLERIVQAARSLT